VGYFIILQGLKIQYYSKKIKSLQRITALSRLTAF